MAENNSPIMKLLKGRSKEDKELQQFRDLMKPPGTFEDGFNVTAFLGALFVAVMMVPGSMYMTLIAGQAIGPAAQWVTLILFIEVSRRANKVLKNAEIFTLFYIAGTIIATTSMAHGNFLGGLEAIWNQFYRDSDAATSMGLAEQIPDWVAPSDPDVLDQRSLLMWEWLPAVGLIAFKMFVGRIDNMVLGYGLFRLTSDIEKLPFPTAPIGAQGILALSEEQQLERKDHELNDDPEPQTPAQADTSWRWRVFSIGSMMGLVFGMIYLGTPTITAALLGSPITIIPLPYIDFSPEYGQFLPAAPIAVDLNLTHILWGMVLPFWAVIGSGVGLLITWVANPVLVNTGILTQWQTGDKVMQTIYKNNVDFYFSFSIGVAIAIALAGFLSIAASLAKRRRQQRDAQLTHPGLSDEEARASDIPDGRGDIHPLLIALTYLITSSSYIALSMYLLYVSDGSIYWPVVWFMLFYAYVYTPLVSYVTARLEGIAGEVLTIPFVREATFILSGYRGVAVWFLPMPFHNYGQMTVLYRQAELTGTSFWSIWKSELLLTPIIILGSLGFAHFIWGLGEIPGPQYLYALEFWELFANTKSLLYSSTSGGFSEFEQAISGSYIAWGAGIGTIVFMALAWLGAPTFLTYGIVKGLNQSPPFFIIPQIIGALIGRYYFQRRLGLKWRQYIPVLFAGFACGMGLIGTLGVGFVFLTKSVFQLPY